MSPRSFTATIHGRRINITMPAQKMMGLHNVEGVVAVLDKMMAALEANGAYVGKDGSAIVVYLYRRDGWVGTMKLQRRSWEPVHMDELGSHFQRPRSQRQQGGPNGVS